MKAIEPVTYNRSYFLTLILFVLLIATSCTSVTYSQQGMISPILLSEVSGLNPQTAVKKVGNHSAYTKQEIVVTASTNGSSTSSSTEKNDFDFQASSVCSNPNRYINKVEIRSYSGGMFWLTSVWFDSSIKIKGEVWEIQQ